MRKFYSVLFLLSVMIFYCSSSAYSVNQTIIVNNSKQSKVEIVNSSPEKLTFKSTLGEISVKDLKTDGGTFVRLSIDRYGKSSTVGFPELPVMHQLMEIPLNATIQIDILSTKVSEINLNDKGIESHLIPLQPSQPKCGSLKAFEINNKLYTNNDFYSEASVSVDVLGVLRGANIGRLNISPISYNPITNVIKVIEEIEFEITFIGGDFISTNDLKLQTRSPYFNGIYGQLNNSQYNANTRNNFTSYPVTYVIVSDRMFEDQLQPFIEWKIRKGFTIVEAYTDEIGNSLDEIKDYLQGLYNAGTPSNPSPSFVLFVGDIAQIPAWNNGSGVTDRNYVEYTGDLFPEIFYGRFSAENTTQLQPYIDKTLMYEQYTMPNPTYLDTVVMVSGVDGSYAPNWGNGQINYGTINYFNEDHDIYSHTYLYPESGSSSSVIKQNISDGATFANYTAHCSPSGWADPSFVINDIPNLTNQDKYGLLIGNCCSSSEYQTVCFAEEILRAENKGAVGYIGGSNSTYWDEDYYFGVGVGAITENPPPYAETSLGNYDRAFHDHGEPFSDWFTTMDQIVFAGNLAVSESGSSKEEYYWDIYNLMGDPSLMIYYSIPEVNTVSHDPNILIGATSFTVNAAPYSYVALNYNGENIGSMLADENGVANLQITGLTIPGTAELVITAQNLQPYFEDINVFSPNGPYCIYESHTINDDSLGNGNNNPDFDEQVFINLSMVNYGNDVSNDVNVTISTISDDVTIEDPTDFFETIGINEVVSNENGLLIHLSNDVEDMTSIIFEVMAVDSQDSIWESQFEILAYAPNLTSMDLIVDDSYAGDNNGHLDPGEVATLKINTANTGHCIAYDVNATLMSLNPYITVLSSDTTIPMLSTFGSSYIEFEVEVANDAPAGILAEMKYELVSGEYNTEKQYYLKVGAIMEDWETGDFTKYDWQTGGDQPWLINDNNPYEGNYDAMSNTIGNDETSELFIEYQLMTNDTISFHKKVSSEGSYDYLKFYIDGELKNEWSGTSDNWTRESYPVEPGLREFRWVYEKDYSQIGGEDKAWIDNIELPMMMVSTVYAGDDNTICENNEFQCTGSATNYATMLWLTSGTGSFNNDTIMDPIYTPSEEDILNGYVDICLSIIDVNENPMMDTLKLSINNVPHTPTTPDGLQLADLYKITQSEYTIDAIQAANSYSWSIYPEGAGVIEGAETIGTVIWNSEFEGNAWIKVCGINDCGMGNNSDSLEVYIINSVGISNLDADIKVNVSPNPSDGMCILKFSSKLKGNASVVITNQVGSVIYSNNVVNIIDGLKLVIDLKDQPSGLYYIKTKTQKGTKVNKLVLVK